MTSTMAGFRSWRQVLSSLLLLIYLPACTSWHVGQPTPAQFVEAEKPGNVRVTRTDGSTLNLLSPVIRGDSLVGTKGPGLVSEDVAWTVSLPLSDVRSVAVKRFSAGNTIGLLGGAMVLLFIAACAGSSSNDFGSPC